MSEWSFLTNHARVLMCIAHDPGVRLRDIATTLGITERSAYGIVTNLAEDGYVVKERRTAVATATTSRLTSRYAKPSAGNGPSATYWTSCSTPTPTSHAQENPGEAQAARPAYLAEGTGDAASRHTAREASSRE